MLIKELIANLTEGIHTIARTELNLYLNIIARDIRYHYDDEKKLHGLFRRVDQYTDGEQWFCFAQTYDLDKYWVDVMGSSFTVRMDAAERFQQLLNPDMDYNWSRDGSKYLCALWTKGKPGGGLFIHAYAETQPLAIVIASLKAWTTKDLSLLDRPCLYSDFKQKEVA